MCPGTISVPDECHFGWSRRIRLSDRRRPRFWKDQHDRRLKAVLQQLKGANVTLNGSKCEFNKSSVKFLGHIVDQNGIRADPGKTSSITKMPTPQSVTEVRRSMGLVNQLGKFSNQIAEISQPVRELLRSDHAWVWGPEQQKAFVRNW